MLNIFYQNNNSLQNTLLINISNNSASIIKKNNDIILGYENNESNESLVFINILNANKYFDNLKNGLLFPTNELCQKIESLTKINITNFFDNGFKIGFITDCIQIQNTHLKKCKVNLGKYDLNIVCGAKNARKNIKVVCATNGTMLPNGKLIINSQLHGIESFGMLCSYKELCITNNNQLGIIELNGGEIGDYFKDVYANYQ